VTGDGAVTLTVVVPATNRPPTLARCVAAIRAAAAAPEELVVVDGPSRAGPAAARNDGARRASGDVVVFVDADVVVHHDAFDRIRRAFEDDRGLAALFGCYDDRPEAPGAVSGFRNLLHHHVHRSAAGPVHSFWAGLGAIRREAFVEVGGFDAGRFPTASIEDVDLGRRLSARGRRIYLDGELQGTHLKAWSVGEMIRTDVMRRGIPWVALLARERALPAELNLGWRHRAGAALSVGAVTALLARRPGIALVALGGLVVLNASFYRLLVERRGAPQAVAGVGLHVVHHLSSVAAVPLGAATHLAAADGER
jgi:GT2 family glycosyltransferase